MLPKGLVSKTVAAGLLLMSAGMGAALVARQSDAGATRQPAPSRPAMDAGSDLRPASAFENVADPAKRSVALFEEAGKVLQHPRCVNCHPSGDRPSQGDEGVPHRPWVRRGADGFGAVGMRCGTCHQAANFDPPGMVGVPGHPKWHVAPIDMAWQGKTLGEICDQIKDPNRNGGHTLGQIVTHMAEDSLVGWAWAPGAGREPAPGTQASFGALIRAWAKSGAVCPAP